MSSSRLGRQIARRACDSCRDRKIKCAWTSNTSCDGCQSAEIFCTFQTVPKRRGRPQSNNLAKYRLPQSPDDSSASIVDPTIHANLHLESLAVAATFVRVEHLCPMTVAKSMISDFLDEVYPLAPLIHVPSFVTQFQAYSYDSEPSFTRLILALCSMTVASLQRKSNIYCFAHYRNAFDIVTRAVHLVQASYLATSPDWTSSPTPNDAVVSLLLGMASHYTQFPTRGWALINSSVSCCRTIGLFGSEGYNDMDAVDIEMCKRTVWMLYFVQIHDRMSHSEPYTLLGYDPSTTDWDFLVPALMSDESITGSSDNPTVLQPPIIGFLALVRTFGCMQGLLSEQGLHSAFRPSLNLLSRTRLHDTFTALSCVLADVVPQLSFSAIMSAERDNDEANSNTRREHHFDIMRSNIHITKLYLQSWVLDRYLSQPSFAEHNQQDLQAYRQEITMQALQVLRFCSQNTLESHGESMVIKIRGIATNLLVQERSQYDDEVGNGEKDANEYVMASFLEILTSLDYAHRLNVA